VLHFDSDEAFEIFFRSNYGRYVHWPRYGFLHSWPSRLRYDPVVPDHGVPYPNTYAPLDRFHASHGYLPKLTCPPTALQWANSLVRERVAPAVPVAVQIRFNPDSRIRDTELSPWAEFLKRMQPQRHIKFVLICRREEIVPELRELQNVIYAKDHGSGVLEDLALVQTARFSMFPASGFCTFPWFCGRPSLYFGHEKLGFPQRRMQDETGKGLQFLSPFQRRIWGAQTADILEREFWSLWNDLEAAGR
jgi:hypothetical protein